MTVFLAIFVAFIVLMVGGMTTLIVVVVRNGIAGRRRRHSAFWELAQRNGWQHLADGQARYLSRQQPVQLHGGTLGIPDALLGERDGVPFVITDQVYTESDGEHTSTYRFSCCQVRLPGYAPQLAVGPENAMTRFGQKFGVHDIQLESADFNVAFNVQCQSARFASDVLNPRTMQWMLGYRQVRLVMKGPDLVVWVPGSLSLQSVDFLLWYSLSLRAQVPSFVWKFLQT